MEKTIGIIIVLFLFVGCKKDIKTSNEVEQIQHLDRFDNKPSQIIFKGKSDDSQALNYFNIMNGSYFIGNNHRAIRRDIYKDSVHFVLDSISSPQFMEVIASSVSFYYEAKIFASPGDTIVFEIKKGKLRFIGQNAIYNNLYSEMYDATPEYYKNPYLDDIKAYKESVKSIYEKKTSFLEDYILKYDIANQELVHIIKTDLKNEYLQELMIPRYKDAGVFDMFHGETDDLVSLIQREFNGNERLFDFDSYFDQVSLADFKDSNMLTQSHFYKDNINLFIRHYFMTSEHADFSQEKLSEEKDFIEKNFTGDLKKYAIARMIWDYNLKGFGYSDENIAYMKSIIEEYKNEFNDKSSKETMAKIQEELSTFNFKLSDLALNTKLVSKYGDTLTVKDIFDQSNKRIRVVDFWASWCPPCISEIKTTKKFKDKLSVENNVEWIYLSLDEDEEKWIERSNELEEYLNVRHQYLVLGGWKSNLATSLKVNGVPRYVVFDRQNKIVLDNAPRASDTIVFNKIVESIKRY